MKFLVTKELGRLCKWLRILGFDTSYSVSEKRAELIIRALRENRIILTRDRRLAQHKGIKMVLVKSDFLKEQLREVIRTLGLKIESEEMFNRCIICNQLLIEIEKEKVKNLVPGYVYQTQEDFVRCPSCKRIYWQGTHWGNVSKTLKEML